jgi:hypothetical protein
MTEERLNSLLDELRNANRWARFGLDAEEDGSPFIHISEAHRRDSHMTLNLSAISPTRESESPVAIEARFIEAVIMSELHTEAKIEFKASRAARTALWGLVVDSTVRGSLLIKDTDGLTVACVSESAKIGLRNSRIRAQRESPVFDVDIHGSGIEQGCRLSGKFASVRLSGQSLELDGAHVGTLSVAAGASHLAVGDVTSIETLVGHARETNMSSTLVVRPLEAKAQTLKSVRIQTCNSLSIEGTAHLVVGTASLVRVQGQGIALSVSSRGENLHFEDEARLELTDEKAVVAGLKGEVTLGNLSGGTLLGDPDHGFLVTGVMPLREIDQPLLGAQLENIRFERGPSGFNSLNPTAHARRVEPDTRNLPGWELRWTLRTRPPVNRDDRLALVYDADLMRRYAEIVRDKGASGSASTKVGWCAQRLRHQVTAGFWEQTALWGYRLLGYGERPGPAFLTWLAASLLLTAVLGINQGFQLDHEGIGNFLNAWSSDAVSPIGSLLRTGSTASDSAWVYLVRAIVAVPLIVGVLALRKYTRAS